MARGSASDKNGGGSNVDTGRATSPSSTKKPKKLSQKAHLQQLVADATELIHRLGPPLIQAIERTKGTERANFTIKFAYNPGSKATAARIVVAGELKTPAGGFSHKVALAEKTGGGLQLDMFEGVDEE
jgi:hypothetical protein